MGNSANLKKNWWFQTKMCASPDLFSVCSEIILPNLEGCPRIKVGRFKISNSRYSNHILLDAKNKEDLQQLFDFEEESSKKGLELNNKKTK